MHTLDTMEPTKQKHIRGNQSPAMNKDIHKAIMTRTKLRNRFQKEPRPMGFGIFELENRVKRP